MVSNTTGTKRGVVKKATVRPDKKTVTQSKPKPKPKPVQKKTKPYSNQYGSFDGVKYRKRKE